MKKLFPFAAMFLVVLMGSCTNDLSSNLPLENLSSDNAASLSSDNAASLSSVNSLPDYLMSPADKSSKNQNPKGGSIQVVNLGTAGEFVILSKSGITDVTPSAITGDIGTSPITGAAILVSCAEVTGKIYSVDAAGPACEVINPTRLGIAVLDMGTAYTDATGRATSLPLADYLNLGAGTIGATTATFAPGVYTWESALNITGDITLKGGPNAVFIFQVNGTLDMASAAKIILTGGAKASNIFWQVTDVVTLGTTSHFEGIVLGKTLIALQTGASINGRLLAQTEVTLQMNAVTQPVNIIKGKGNKN